MGFSCVFVWLGLHRQIRIDGPIEFVPGQRSRTSTSIPDRLSLSSPQPPHLRARWWLTVSPWNPEGRRAAGWVREWDLRRRPPEWGGVRVRPATMVEFWQGRPHQTPRPPGLYPRGSMDGMCSGWLREARSGSCHVNAHLEQMKAHATEGGGSRSLRAGGLCRTGHAVASDLPHRPIWPGMHAAFLVDPVEHFAALQHAEGNGWTIGGVFHSHPNGARGAIVRLT